MNLNDLFGHWQTWLMLLAVWVSLGALTAIAFGLIARVGKGREGRGGK